MQLSDHMAREGLKDDDLALKIPRSRATISRYRRRKQRPSLEIIKEIERVTGGLVTVDDWVSQ